MSTSIDRITDLTGQLHLKNGERISRCAFPDKSISDCMNDVPTLGVS